MNGRIGATVEYLISVVNLNVDIDAWGVFISFMIGAWEVQIYFFSIQSTIDNILISLETLDLGKMGRA